MVMGESEKKEKDKLKDETGRNYMSLFMIIWQLSQKDSCAAPLQKQII